MNLLLAAESPVEIVPVLVAVAGLLVTTGASLTARSWYVTRHTRREWEYLDDRESDEEMDDREEDGTRPLTRD